MPHLHTDPGQHDHTVSAYVVRLDTPKPTIMLHRHKKLGVFMQFGGHIEWHENLWQAIVHELREESGYDIGQLQVLQPCERIMVAENVTLHPYPVLIFTHKFPGLDHYHTDTSFAFVANEPPRHAVGAGESAEVHSFTEAQLLSLPADEIYENNRQICLFALNTCVPNWERVSTEGWG